MPVQSHSYERLKALPSITGKGAYVQNREKHGGTPVDLSVGGIIEPWTAEIFGYTVPNARWEQSKLVFP